MDTFLYKNVGSGAKSGSDINFGYGFWIGLDPDPAPHH